MFFSVQLLSAALTSKLLHTLMRFSVSALPACRRSGEGSPEQPFTKGAELALDVQRVTHCLVDRRGNLESALAVRIFENRDALEQSGAHRAV